MSWKMLMPICSVTVDSYFCFLRLVIFSFSFPSFFPCFASLPPAISSSFFLYPVSYFAFVSISIVFFPFCCSFSWRCLFQPLLFEYCFSLFYSLLLLGECFFPLSSSPSESCSTYLRLVGACGYLCPMFFVSTILAYDYSVYSANFATM